MKSFCLALVVLVFAGAALSADKKDTAPAQRTAKTPPANAAAKATAKVEVTYLPADSPVSENGLLWLKQLNYLEAIAEDIQTSIRLPKPLSLVGQPCGEPNAFYVREGSDERFIVICYELVDLIIRQADKAKGQGSRRKLPEESRAMLALGAVTFITLHEMGHALIDILDLPITGREEDVADQIATFLSLHDLKDEEDHEIAKWIVVGGSWYFHTLAQQGQVGSLAGEHSLDEQRLYNIACWTYGSNPRRYTDLVPVFRGASDRLLGCEAEHARMHRALTTLIGPSLIPQ